MYYRTREEEFDLNGFSGEERKLFEWLMGEYGTAKHWVTFQQRTARIIVDAVQKIYTVKWGSSALYKIQLDLVANVGIKEGQLKGDLSDMIVEK